MMANETALLTELENNGCKGKLVAIRHLDDLRAELAKQNQAGFLKSEFLNDPSYLAGCQYDYSEIMPNAESLIIVAVPQPITKLRFTWQGKQQTVVIPPTYIYSAADNLATEIAERELTKGNFSCKRIKIPYKILAVRSGLAQYGRNNITYIHGMGSYYRLVAFATDMPVISDNWQEIEMMPECSSCRACLNSCPTKCIDPDRSVIHGEKCLTYFNESAKPFPDSVGSNWHNSLLGCMKCQLACPQNKTGNPIVEIENPFTEQELAMLFTANDYSELPETTLVTLQKLNLTDYDLPLPAIQRNFKSILV